MTSGKFNHRCPDGVTEEREHCGHSLKVGYLATRANPTDNCAAGPDLPRDGVLVVFFVFLPLPGTGGIAIVLDTVFVRDHRVTRNDEPVCPPNDAKSKIPDLDWIDPTEKVICLIGPILE